MTQPRPNKPKSLRQAFRHAVTAGLLAVAPMSSVSSSAQQSFPQISQTGASIGMSQGQGIARNQGYCPTGSTASRAPENFPFPVPPAEQQRLLKIVGLDIGREQPDGLFRERTLQSINEFRQLYYGPQRGAAMPFAQTFTAAELADLREVAIQVQRDTRAHRGLQPAAAMTLRLAARATGVPFATLLDETDNGRSGFNGTASEWIYMVKTQGAKYGLQYFMDQISLRTDPATGKTLVRVSDPVAYELIDALRHLPRLSLMMAAEELKLDDAMPTVDYDRATPPAGIPLTRLQADLLTLGFPIGGIDNDFGPGTESAYKLYVALYSPLVPEGQSVDAYMAHFADLAQRDARQYGVPAPAAAAIRLASLRTGADFGYLMELSAQESGFDHDIGASTSSATGLFQFTEDTWLQTVNRYGFDYSMASLADQMDNIYDINGMLVGRVENPFIRQAAFDLRAQPHLSSLMGAEFQLRNKFRVECEIKHPLNRTEMYFGHFLGPDGAITFLQNRARTPGGPAARAFPQQAAANRSVFYSRGRRGRLVPRSYDEVYAFFNRKFDRAIYEDSGNVRALGITLRTPYEISNRPAPAAYVPPATNDSMPLPPPPAPVLPAPVTPAPVTPAPVTTVAVVTTTVSAKPASSVRRAHTRAAAKPAPKHHGKKAHRAPAKPSKKRRHR